MDKSVPRGSIEGAATPPCSKSYAQRALAAALLTHGETTLRNIEFCNDTLAALHCIETLGAKVERVDDCTLKIRGGLNPAGNRLEVGESGLATRLFTPIAALCNQKIKIDGEGTILSRPIDMMTEPL